MRWNRGSSLKLAQTGFILLALVGWLFPSYTIAEEKPALVTVAAPVIENWVISKDDITPEQSKELYQNWQKAKVAVAPKPKVVVTSTDKTRKTKFAGGNCTDYVARKVEVTWRGNANRWLPNAAAQGYRTDKVPEPGAILVTNESRYGHVSYIESVSGEVVTVSEWNVGGKYVKTIREFNINDKRIVGIIHTS
mgnify:CR=1 FL=1